LVAGCPILRIPGDLVGALRQFVGHGVWWALLLLGAGDATPDRIRLRGEQAVLEEEYQSFERRATV
jgi:hypothetical protein